MGLLVSVESDSECAMDDNATVAMAHSIFDAPDIMTRIMAHISGAHALQQLAAACTSLRRTFLPDAHSLWRQLWTQEFEATANAGLRQLTAVSNRWYEQYRRQWAMSNWQPKIGELVWAKFPGDGWWPGVVEILPCRLSGTTEYDIGFVFPKSSPSDPSWPGHGGFQIKRPSIKAFSGADSWAYIKAAGGKKLGDETGLRVAVAEAFIEFRQQVSAGKNTVEGPQEVATHSELCAHLHLP